MQASNRGFTLIELLVVIATIGILAAVAVPQYFQYTQRAQATQTYASLAAFKTLISAHLQIQGAFPENAEALGAGSADDITFNADEQTIAKVIQGSNEVSVTLTLTEGQWQCTTSETHYARFLQNCTED